MGRQRHDVGRHGAAAWATAGAAHGLTRTTTAILVWVAAVLAMVTKGSLAVTLGAGIRLWIADHVSPRHVRYFAVARSSCLAPRRSSRCSAS